MAENGHITIALNDKEVLPGVLNDEGRGRSRRRRRSTSRSRSSSVSN